MISYTNAACVTIAFASCEKAKKEKKSSENAPLFFFFRIVDCFRFIPQILSERITLLEFKIPKKTRQ
jgi:hypothetical protein